MPDSLTQRLGSFYLEDLAIVALTAAAEPDTLARHPELDDDRRAKLRSRLKQVGRHDWPASLRDDPLLRRGYTLRQCCRLVTALMLIDAHLAPSEAIALAQANELCLLRAIVQRLAPGKHQAPDPDDLLVVVPLGELVSLVADRLWNAAQPRAVRLMRRGDLPSLWSGDADLGFPGQRLVLDIGLAMSTAWQWLVERNLMNDDARKGLLAEIKTSDGKPGFAGEAAPIPRHR